MKAGHGRRNRRRPVAKKGKISQAAFDFISRTIIVVLCIYIVGHCTSLIFGDKVKMNCCHRGKIVNMFVEATIKIQTTQQNGWKKMAKGIILPKMLRMICFIQRLKSIWRK